MAIIPSFLKLIFMSIPASFTNCGAQCRNGGADIAYLQAQKESAHFAEGFL